MAHRRIFKPTSLVFTPLLLLLMIAVACGGAAATRAPRVVATVAPAATAAPAAAATATAVPEATSAPAGGGQAVTGRLKVAITSVSHESNLHWIGTIDALTQLRPMNEYLMDLDAETGVEIPMLATEWDLSPDATKWTFKLRKGVPFHFGQGEFTAKDVAHSNAMLRQEEAIQSFTTYWREIVDNIEVIDDYTVQYNLTHLDPDMYWYAAANAEHMIVSKEQWDTAGRDGMDKKPAGTGPYQYVDRQLGQWFLLERTPYKHWRITPDFEEMQIFFVPEDFTRLAMLLAEESDISSMSRSLHQQAKDAGMQIIPALFPSISANAMFGGQYYVTPDALDETVPWANPKTGKLVREAMNRAINRQEIIDTLFGGVADPMPVVAHHPTKPGWNPRWVEVQASGKTLFEERYGYDPEKARALLKEAGYPNGFSFEFHTFPQSGFPETRDLADAFQLYFTDIGLDVKLIEQATLARTREKYKTYTAQNVMWIFRGGARLPQVDMRVFYSPKGIVHVYESQSLVDNWAKFNQSADADKRDEILTEMADELFDEYARIPVAWFFFDVVVNPKVIAEYKFPGTITGIVTHLESVKAVKR